MFSLSSRPWTILTFCIHKRSSGKQNWLDHVDLISGLLNNICVHSRLFLICDLLHSIIRSFNKQYIWYMIGFATSLSLIKLKGKRQLTPATSLCRTTCKVSISKHSSVAQLAISTAQIFRFFCRRLQIPTVICNFRPSSSSSTSSQRITPYQVSVTKLKNYHLNIVNAKW